MKINAGRKKLSLNYEGILNTLPCTYKNRQFLLGSYLPQNCEHPGMWQEFKEATRITPNQWFDDNGVLVIPKGHKVSSHLDLFYDLVFVVALASLGKDFRHKAHEGEYDFAASLYAVLDMGAMLVPILMNHVFLHAYTNRFGRGTFGSCLWYLGNFLRMFL